MNIGIALKLGLKFDETSAFSHFKTLVFTWMNGPSICGAATKYFQIELEFVLLINKCSMVSFTPSPQQQYVTSSLILFLFKIYPIGILFFQSLHKKKETLNGTPLTQISLKYYWTSSFCLKLSKQTLQKTFRIHDVLSHSSKLNSYFIQLIMSLHTSSLKICCINYTFQFPFAKS